MRRGGGRARQAAATPQETCQNRARAGEPRAAGIAGGFSGGRVAAPTGSSCSVGMTGGLEVVLEVDAQLDAVAVVTVAFVVGLGVVVVGEQGDGGEQAAAQGQVVVEEEFEAELG